jgi:hypothetical protein
MIIATIGAIAYYSPIVSSQQDQIGNLQTQVSRLTNQNTNQYAQLQSEVSSLQSQLSDANGINGLHMSTTWLSLATVNQNVGSAVYYQYTADYAGYITVNVQTSTTSNQYVQATWTSQNYRVDYSNKITVGNSGTAMFPVLPSADIRIYIGNTNLLNGATATVTITYTY